MDEKLKIKNLIFSKNPAITNFFEDLKNPITFDIHLKTLKRIIKSKEEKNDKIIKQKKILKFNFPSKNYLFSSEKINFKKFKDPNETINNNSQNSNQSLLMDSNESIIFIEKTNQNLFSEEEAENLSTTLGLELINESTTPSTPLNARTINDKIKQNPGKNFSHEGIKRKESKSSILRPNSFDYRYQKLDLEEIKMKILKQKNYRSDDENVVKLN